jgi:hypothetical protein
LSAVLHLGGKGMNFFLKFQTKITLFFKAKINVISFSLQLEKNAKFLTETRARAREDNP